LLRKILFWAIQGEKILCFSLKASFAWVCAD
jgi:hypothetical protein